MPIEDADKLHSKHGGSNKPTIRIFKHDVGIMKLMIVVGVGLAAIFILIAGWMLMFPPAPLNINNTTIQETPVPIIKPNVSFETMTTNYNYTIIKLSYNGDKTIPNVQNDLLLSLYPPPQSPHYIQRQAINNNNITEFNSQRNTLYVYTGIDNSFHMSYIIPKYSDCIDFINGDWGLNIDDNVTHQNLYTFKFNMTNSRSKIIENSMSINESIQGLPEYSTLLVYSGLYKERLSVLKPIRIIGIGNPVIDAGGSGSGITLKSNNNVISGMIIANSGNKELLDGGIFIMPFSTGNIITQNTIYRTIYGIFIYQSNSNTIANNTIRDNDRNGIMVVSSLSNIIINNIIYNNVDGIHVNSLSDLNIIRENNVYDNKGYGIIIENYKALSNTCEYNIYKNNKMSCSDSIDRDLTPVVQVTTVPSDNGNIDDWWASCNGNPKCYQSQK